MRMFARPGFPPVSVSRDVTVTIGTSRVVFTVTATATPARSTPAPVIEMPTAAIAAEDEETRRDA